MPTPTRFARLLLVLVACVAVLCVIGASTAGVEAMQPAQDEFVPIAQLPPEDRLPAAPLLIAAYSFVWVALLGYLWFVWRRVGSVEQQLQEVGRRLSQRTER